MYDPNLRLYNCFKFTNKLPQPYKDPVFMNGTFLIYMTCYMTQYQLSGTILLQPECIAYQRIDRPVQMFNVTIWGPVEGPKLWF